MSSLYSFCKSQDQEQSCLQHPCPEETQALPRVSFYTGLIGPTSHRSQQHNEDFSTGLAPVTSVASR